MLNVRLPLLVTVIVRFESCVPQSTYSFVPKEMLDGEMSATPMAPVPERGRLGAGAQSTGFPCGVSVTLALRAVRSVGENVTLTLPELAPNAMLPTLEEPSAKNDASLPEVERPTPLIATFPSFAIVNVLVGVWGIATSPNAR